MATYSFGDVSATLNSPQGTIQLGQGAGVSDEGITTSHADEKDTVTTGADGSIMHSLRMSMTGRIVIRLLKTSPINAALNQLYNTQRLPPSNNWGVNTISINNIVSGDTIVGTQMAFAKHPDIVMATVGNFNEWDFVGYVVPELGDGNPDLGIVQA